MSQLHTDISTWLRQRAIVRVLLHEQFGQTLQMIAAISLLVIANFSWYSPTHASAAGTNMYLFWDPANGSAPSGWTVITTYDGFFPYGAAVTDTFGATTTVPGRPYTPTASATTTGLGSTLASFVSAIGAISSNTHVHPTVPIVYGPDTGDPANPDLAAFRSYQLIKYSGIPTIVPQNAVAMFAGTLPSSGFTRVTANDQRLIRVNSTTTIGGSDTESNTVKISGLDADSTNTVNNQTNGQTGPVAPANHTHASPSSLTCTAGCGTPTCTPPGTLATLGGSTQSNTFTCTTTGDIPPYVVPVLGQATANVPTISVNLTAIFDGDPGSGWTVLSNVGGSFYHQFLRPNASYSAVSQGSVSRNLGYSATYGSALGTAVNGKVNGTNGASQFDHLHSLTMTINTLSNMVPSFNAVIGQKVSFTMNAYRWFVDASGNSGSPDFNTTNVSDPWPVGALNLAQDTQLPAIPTQYLPPDVIVKTSLRLRAQILVSGQALVANSTTFKLQYQVTGSDDCLTGTWTDVAPNGTPAGPTSQWTYGTNTLADSTRLTTSALTPTSSVLQYYSRSTGGAITGQTVGTGQSMEYDWLVQNNNANTGTEYHIRIVEGNGTPLSLYQNTTTSKAECPDVITKPGVDQELRHGDFFLPDPNSNVSNDPDQGYAWVD